MRGALKTVRSLAARDLIGFGLPALVVFLLGLLVSARAGYEGLLRILWRLITNPRDISRLSTPHTAGLLLFLVGSTIALIAGWSLCRRYVAGLFGRKDRFLVTRGVYRLVRHPLYLGVLLACFAPPVYASSLLAGLIMALLVPLFVHRIRVEEVMLTDEFGEAYRDYRRATKKLIPFVY